MSEGSFDWKDNEGRAHIVSSFIDKSWPLDLEYGRVEFVKAKPLL